MANRTTLPALIMVALCLSSNLAALTEMTVDDVATGEMRTHAGEGIYTDTAMGKIMVPCAVQVRVKAKKFRAIEWRFSERGCLSLNLNRLTALPSVVSAGDDTTISGILLTTTTDAWYVDESGEALPFGKWEFGNTKDNRKGMLTWSAYGVPEKKRAVSIEKLAYTPFSLGKSEQTELNKGKCPPAVMDRLRSAGLLSTEKAVRATPTSTTNADTPLPPVRRLRMINDAETAKINATVTDRSNAARTTAIASLATLRDELTKSGKIDEAVAVKALAENPDSAEAKAGAPDQAKAVLSRYETTVASAKKEGETASAALHKNLLQALDKENKAAMKRGDLETCVALKKVIDADGRFGDEPAAAPLSGDQGR